MLHTRTCTKLPHKQLSEWPPCFLFYFSPSFGVSFPATNPRAPLKMAWLTVLSTAGVLLCTCFAYVVHAVYNHRRKINALRKQGVVSTLSPAIDDDSKSHADTRLAAHAERLELDHGSPTYTAKVP